MSKFNWYWTSEKRCIWFRCTLTVFPSCWLKSAVHASLRYYQQMPFFSPCPCMTSKWYVNTNRSGFARFWNFFARIIDLLSCQSVTNFDSSALLWDITCILCGLVWPAIISHYATFISDRVSSIGEMAYDSNWPDYPPYLGKHIILITARSQHPVFFHGLGLVGCNREVFGRVCILMKFTKLFLSLVGPLKSFNVLLYVSFRLFSIHRFAEHLHLIT